MEVKLRVCSCAADPDDSMVTAGHRLWHRGGLRPVLLLLHIPDRLHRLQVRLAVLSPLHVTLDQSALLRWCPGGRPTTQVESLGQQQQQGCQMLGLA